MKKITSLALLLSLFTSAFAQEKKEENKVNLTHRAGDHLMIQLSSDNWTSVPDSIGSHKGGGLSRGFNVAFMFNKPFKTDPRWSVAFGLGFSNSNIFFQSVHIGVEAPGTVLPFTDLSQSDHFKKYKLSTSFVEIPIELRYTFKPERPNKSWKLAAGIKAGTMLDAHTKGKTWVDKDGNPQGNYVEKISRTTFFNTSRLCGTLRVGYGVFSLFGSYSITAFLKDGAGPEIHAYQIGLTLSGL